MSELQIISLLIMQENMLFSREIYSAGKIFTLPPAVTVVTNLTSVLAKRTSALWAVYGHFLIHRRKSICWTWDIFFCLSINYLPLGTFSCLTSKERGQVSTVSTAVVIFKSLEQAPTHKSPFSESFHRNGAQNVNDLKNISIVQNLLQIFDRTWHSAWSTIMPFL